MEINRERLATFFVELCSIESPSRKEGKVAEYLKKQFARLGANAITVDDSAAVTGADTGNLVIRFGGDEKLGEKIFFACHMDTVGPTEGIEVVRNGDMFTSRGETVLGADDKSGIAPLLELITLLKENDIAHCPFELVFTTCEEIGLLGAKAMDPGMIEASYGYALDSTCKGKIIAGAPAANRLKVTVRGRAAHSGLAPETGINALDITAHAITQITLGRVDSQSTANFGLISGGTATNIIPELVEIEGEVRSHSRRMLDVYTSDIENVFNRVVENWPRNGNSQRPSVSIEVREDFPLMRLRDDEPVLKRIGQGIRELNRPLVFDVAGGGSDANIFCGKGLPTAIVPTGMNKVHSTEEEVDLADMVALTELLYTMVTKGKALQ